MSMVSVVRGPVYVLHSSLASPSPLVYVQCHSLPSACVPPRHAEQPNEACHADCVVHVRSRNRLDGWEEQDNADEAHPCDCDGVDRLAPPTHRVRSRNELHSMLVNPVRDDDSNVADVECWRRDVENGDNRQRASDTDQIQAAAERDDKPDSIHRCMCSLVDFAPKSVSHQP